MWLVVGLGNPGSEYERTRHNLGFMVVDELAAARARPAPPKAKLGAEVREGKLGAERLLLCKPMEFMNLSGEAVGRVAGFWKVAARPAGRGATTTSTCPSASSAWPAAGGHGGHNGMRSIIATMGRDFFRVRVGIGRPHQAEDASRRVLGGFSTGRAERAAHRGRRGHARRCRPSCSEGLHRRP